MEGNLSPRIIGACVLGFAMVAGAYVFSNFGEPRLQTQRATIATASAPRAPIAVVDQDNNGLEDWRDEFIETEPIILEDVATPEYQPPDTLTGQFGINLVEGSLRSLTYGPLGRSKEQVANDSVDYIEQETVATLYDLPDITVMQDWDDNDIRTYANTMALNILNNNIADSQGELYVLDDYLRSNDPTQAQELAAIAAAYKAMRDITKDTPVPSFLVKEHLDLLNTYNAIYSDVNAMSVVSEDPLVTLARLKRYENDASALSLALAGIYNALLPYADLLEADDPALLFVSFSPDFN